MMKILILIFWDVVEDMLENRKLKENIQEQKNFN